MNDLARIGKECFWDLNYSEKEIKAILNGDESQSRQLLFNKILLNSTKVLRDLQLFPKEELYNMLEDFVVPQFNQEYIIRRKNIAEVYFFDKPLEINELKWLI